MTQGKIVQEITDKQILYPFCNRYTSCAHTQWIGHTRDGFIEVFFVADSERIFLKVNCVCSGNV